jgi:hypothetical protein
MVGVAQSLRVARLGRSEHNGGVGEASDVLLRELTEALSMILGGLGAFPARAGCRRQTVSRATAWHASRLWYVVLVTGLGCLVAAARSQATR